MIDGTMEPTSSTGQHDSHDKISQSLSDLSLDDNSKNNNIANSTNINEQSSNTDNALEFVNITNLFDTLCSKLKPQSIVKDPNFDLFQGTHALEINNIKLDSSLIKLTKQEIEFDCDIPYGDTEIDQLKYVSSIMDRILRSIICWLNEYHSLPTTLLSCRYVDRLLSTDKTSQEFAYTSFETGSRLYDSILSSGIIGVSYFAAFVKTLLARGVLFEEEDLNFNFMGIQGFDKLPKQNNVLDALERSIDYIQNNKLYNDNQHALHLLKLLKIIVSLVKIEDILSKYSTETKYLDDMRDIAKELDADTSLMFEVPPGSFSMAIQKTLSNQYPPKELVEPKRNYLGFATMAEDIKVILKVAEIDTAVETLQFANFFNKLTQKHVIARGVFPLFLLRENHTVIGKFAMDDFLHSHFMEFSLFGTKILENVESSSHLQDMLTQSVQECANVLFEFYQNSAQNTSRYRQGYNRQLLLWDSAQAQLETAELNFISMDIFDQVDKPNATKNDGVSNTDAALMPYASWVFSMKVFAMIEFTLKGFDLEVYKPFESYDMFFSVYNLSHQLGSCLDKVHLFIQNKISSIHSINKKIKKLKAGPKKDKLRNEYNELMETQMEQLQINKQFLNYLIHKCQINKSMALAQVLQFALLKSIKCIDNVPLVDNKFLNPKLIHDLRFKTFSSIGVPELPSYDMFLQSLDGFVIKDQIGSNTFNQQLERINNYMNKELEQAGTSINTIIRGIRANDKNGEIYTGTRLVKDEALSYYSNYLKSVEMIRDNSQKILKIIKQSSATDALSVTYKVELTFVPGASTYYPLLSLTKKINYSKTNHK